MTKLTEYKHLLSKSYDEAIAFLLEKYGAAQDDYYRERSYYRFLKGEIKNITYGKYSRTSEGLYCHHIDEIKELKISDQSYVKANNLSFEYQKKDRLVYCDLIEHTILHTLIAKETSQQYGLPGYLTHLKPMIEDWYIEERIPSPAWMVNCYHQAFLYPYEAVDIVKAMQAVLGMSYFNTADEYFEDKQRKVEEDKARNLRLEEGRRKEGIELAKRAKEKEKQIAKERNEHFYQIYPKFKRLNIRFDSPRRKVISMLYEYKYSELFKTKKGLELEMRPVIKDELFKELYVIISAIEEE